MADLINLSPDDKEDLDSLRPVEFSVVDGAASVFTSVFVQYEGSSDTLIVYDGENFFPPFAANSTVHRPIGDDTIMNFSIIPEGGWAASIEAFTVQIEEP